MFMHQSPAGKGEVGLQRSKAVASVSSASGRSLKGKMVLTITLPPCKGCKSSSSV